MYTTNLASLAVEELFLFGFRVRGVFRLVVPGGCLVVDFLGLRLELRPRLRLGLRLGA